MNCAKPVENSVRRWVTWLCLVAAVVTLTGGPTLYGAAVSDGRAITNAMSDRFAPISKVCGILAVAALAFGVAIHVKETTKIADKFVTRAGQAASDYKDGVANAGSSWETQSKTAEPSYNQGVQAAISRGAYGKGVTGKAAKFQTNAVNNGAVRYGPGVANAKDAYARGIQPYLDKLKSLDLPPKGPRRSPQNMQRVTAVDTALAALKEGK